jgi:hypothetical protein
MDAVKSRVGNVYGLDIKLTPKNGSYAPVCIEINGVDSGTDFFKYPAGRSFYKAFAKALGAETNFKPIFIEEDSKHRLNPLEVLCEAKSIMSELEEDENFLPHIMNVFGPGFEFDYSWLKDVASFNIKQLSAPWESESSFYSLAGSQNSVPIYSYDLVDFGKEAITFYLPTGKALRLSPTEIGAIKIGSESMEAAPNRFRGLFLSTSFTENIINSKALTAYAVSGTPLQAAMPPTIAYGLGVNRLEDVISFLEGLNSDLIVRKRGTSRCGAGVEILDRKSHIMQLKSKSHSSPKYDSFVIDAFFNYLFVEPARDDLRGAVAIYQEFVPSKGIYNPNTGKMHDGCARIIVYSPKIGEPFVLGGQWRLSPAPLSDENADINSRLRANLSRGASAVPMGPDELEIAAHFSTMFVKGFEKQLETLYKISEDEKPFDNGRPSGLRNGDFLFVKMLTQHFDAPGILNARNRFRDAARREWLEGIGRKYHFMESAKEYQRFK